MLTPQLKSLPLIAKRNFRVMAPVMQKATDPIQQLFIEKIREYKNKSSGGKLVDASPEIKKELESDLQRLATQYGGGPGIDMTKFPTFKFEDPKIETSISNK
ncbi:hypothetical protein PV325_010954 [Microctonus aethiopoides]|uniref:ATP synthase-coupling factor 6, mitochondrial n=1 Tax=Microctonus aethiopoides TaxID=144406 RepID=A0AA39C951_9HYME|nr:hypothetical protein PV325_010954 [Microctonus aethiopoides]KAK0098901.1 hypothetical protein PV326_000062 [Microctonus aethiopoides]KAK0159889.1 hypothetical protein PV328_007353 [Microctonus aethiopoides]